MLDFIDFVEGGDMGVRVEVGFSRDRRFFIRAWQVMRRRIGGDSDGGREKGSEQEG